MLVNNAGVTAGRQPTDFAMIDRVIDTNLKGAMYCTFAALPAMREWADQARIESLRVERYED